MKKSWFKLLILVVIGLIITFGSSDLYAQSKKSVLTIANAVPDKGQIVNHKYYVLGYNSAKHNPDWVAYLLTRQMVRQNNSKRNNKFKTDPSAKGCATPKDYTKSGYDKGHICPAADMAFSQQAQDITFYMSNMTPQMPAFNRGVWKRLEEKVRDWAKENDSIIVLAGPIYANGKTKIGNTGVVVPEKFYKIVIDISYPTYKAIAFVIPNQGSKQDIYSFSVSIDKIEQMTGLNFFPKYDSNKFVTQLEKTNQLKQWQR